MESFPKYGFKVMQSTPRFSKADLAYASAVEAISPRFASRIMGMREPKRFDSALMASMTCLRAVQPSAPKTSKKAALGLNAAA